MTTDRDAPKPQPVTKGVPPLKTVHYVLGTLAVLEVIDVICFAPKFGLYRHRVLATQSHLRKKFGFVKAKVKSNCRVVPVLCTMLLLLMLPQAFAQIIAGRVVGRVTDASGAVVPNASITLTNNETNVAQTVESSSSGEYVFQAVLPGNYTLTVEANGFEEFVVKSVEVHTQSTLSEDVNLKVGDVTDKVTVTAEAPLLQTQDASLGQTITAQQVNDMPLNGRDFTQLSMIAAGTISGSGANTSIFTSEGTNPGQNDFRLNGIDDNIEMYGGGHVQGVSQNAQTSVVPPPDALDEFKVQSGNYSAEFGHSSSAVVNAQIKSGTNRLHGAAWEYVRNTIFNANLFANKFNTPITPRSPYHENQFGGTVGGPVFIPKLYDGRDKTFFFVSYQDSRLATPTPFTSSVPTENMINSGFTNFQDYLNPSYHSGTKADALNRTFPYATMFDPKTMRYVAAGAVDPVTGLTNQVGYGAYVSDPFYTGGSVGNIQNFTGLTQHLNQLPAGRIDPNAVRLLSVYPAPNIANIGTSNYYRNQSTDNTLSQWDVRIDEHIRDKDMLFGTYDESDNVVFEPSPFPGIADGGGYGTGTTQGPHYSISLGYTHIFTPTLTNEAHAGWSHAIEKLVSPNGNTMGIPEQYGIGGIPQIPYNGGLPEISNTFSLMGPSGSEPTLDTVRALELMDNVTKVLSKHTLKVGYQLNHIVAPIIQPGHGSGYLSYSGAFSDIPNQYNGSTGVADMLLIPSATDYPQYGGANNLGGITQSYLSNYAQTKYARYYMGAYVQDDWRVTPKLTLNLGLRYDRTTPIEDVNGHDSNLVQSDGDSGAGTSATYVIAKGGCNIPLSPAFSQITAQDNITIACASGNTLSKYQHLNFAPRIGFAYSVDARTVVRGGYGITYGGLDNQGYFGIGQNYPFIVNYNNFSSVSQAPATVSSGATTVMENTFTSPGILDAANLPAYGVEGSSFSSVSSTIKTNYQQTVNLTFQRQISNHDVFSLGYVGTFGRHLDTNPPNNAPSAIMPPGVSEYDPTVQGHIPFPDFSSGIATTGNSTSSYNALQTNYQHQLTHNIDLIANWTWSRCMSDQMGPEELIFNQRSGSGSYRAPYLPGFGMKGDWSICSFDATRVTHVAGTWHLPVGQGQTYLGNGNHLTNAFIGGWATNLIYIDQSGQPFTVGCPVATTSDFGCNANTTGQNLYAGAHNQQHWVNADAFLQPPTATVTGQTNFAPLGGKPAQARGPAFQNIDMSLFKQFPVHDTMKFEFRAEAFNVGNWVQFANPGDTNFTDTVHFGELTSTRNSNRIMQLALKLYY
jgi:Carboxypeptidase regulatory-like domain